MFQNPICSGMKVFLVFGYRMITYSFQMSIFPSPEFKKLMIYDRRLDTYKIVPFGGI